MTTSTSRVSPATIDLDDNGDPTVGTYDIYSYDDKGAFSVEGQVEKESGE